jgi:hypothetical protein
LFGDGASDLMIMEEKVYLLMTGDKNHEIIQKYFDDLFLNFVWYSI